MSINHNRIKVADLEKNQPNKILTTNIDGELEFSNVSDILVNDLTTGGTTKALTAEMGKSLQNTKVDKVTGKSLVFDTEITRLGTLSNYTHPANHPPSIITQDASNRFVTDAEKAAWNAKQSSLGFTAENVANKNVANGYAGLGADGKLISSQLPSITINNTFVTASQAAMLALTVETGDIAVRTDLNKSFILKGVNPTLLEDWQELLTSTSAVTTVTGALVDNTDVKNPIVNTPTLQQVLNKNAVASFDSGKININLFEKDVEDPSESERFLNFQKKDGDEIKTISMGVAGTYIVSANNIAQTYLQMMIAGSSFMLTKSTGSGRMSKIRFKDPVSDSFINFPAPAVSGDYTLALKEEITKSSVGLGNSDNTTDLNKPISTATQEALNLKASLASPPLTGIPTAPTATVGTNTTQIATTAFVMANATNIPHLEFNNANKTVWNNGMGNIDSNTSYGLNALNSNIAGSCNTANGYQVLYSNTTGGSNTANGYYAMYSNTTGTYNVANGYQVLYSNTTGSSNTASGYQALRFNTTGNYNTANGGGALFYNTTGIFNTASGYQALESNTTGNNNTANGVWALYSNTQGINNTASGSQALYCNTSGNNNTANGYQTLYFNTTGNNNVANGYQTLYSITTGFSNTANGFKALYSSTTGNSNVANGSQALYSSTTGNSNTANGSQALYSNTTGNNNVANGTIALTSNTIGVGNTANGVQALFSNTTGNNNVANGYQALYSNTTGGSNTANGVSAGRYIANGSTSLSIANQSTFLGANTKALVDNSINETVIGYNAIGAGSNTVTIGNSAVTKNIFNGNIQGTSVRTTAVTPVQGSTIGEVNEIRAVAGFIYVCSGGTVWTRAALSTF
jgi:hypothetical protein